MSFITSFLKLIRHRAPVVLGVIIVAIFVMMAIFGPFIAPYDATTLHVDQRFAPPSRVFPLGTDNFGRDIASRIILGTRSILSVAVLATGLAILLGTFVGLISGYLGGVIDEISTRLLDTIMSIPLLLMVMMIISVLGTSIVYLVLGVGVIYTPLVARVVRSGVLQERTKDYVSVARVRGESVLYIVSREILPNIASQIIVEGSIRIGYAILLVATLGFLGLGVQPPTPDWGLMVSEGRSFIITAPNIVLVPAGAIALLVIGINLLADGIKEAYGISGERMI